MATFQVTTEVQYTFYVEADNEAQAEAEGWKYENYKQFGEVQEVYVYEYPEGEEPDEAKEA